MSDNNLLALFKTIKTASELEAFESKNRATIEDAPGDVRRAFNEKWKEVTGQWYYVPVTSIPRPVEVKPGSMHPKSADYRYVRRARAIQWEKIVEPRKAGQQFYNATFHMVRAVLEDGSTNLVCGKSSKEIVARLCGKDIADKIAKEKGTSGTFEVDQDVTCIGYWEAMFHPKAHENDTPDVLLAAMGLALQMKRQVPVVVPGPHLEKADQGTYPKYHEEPGVPRKIVAWVQFYPYTVLREASEAEFLSQKAKGDAVEQEEKRRLEGR